MFYTEIEGGMYRSNYKPVQVVSVKKSVSDGPNPVIYSVPCPAWGNPFFYSDALLRMAEEAEYD